MGDSASPSSTPILVCSQSRSSEQVQSVNVLNTAAPAPSISPLDPPKGSPTRIRQGREKRSTPGTDGSSNGREAQPDELCVSVKRTRGAFASAASPHVVGETAGTRQTDVLQIGSDTVLSATAHVGASSSALEANAAIGISDTDLGSDANLACAGGDGDSSSHGSGVVGAGRTIMPPVDMVLVTETSGPEAANTRCASSAASGAVHALAAGDMQGDNAFDDEATDEPQADAADVVVAQRDREEYARFMESERRRAEAEEVRGVDGRG